LCPVFFLHLNLKIQKELLKTFKNLLKSINIKPKNFSPKPMFFRPCFRPIYTASQQQAQAQLPLKNVSALHLFYLAGGGLQA